MLERSLRISVLTVTLAGAPAAVAATANPPDLPVVDGKPALATVNGVPITLEAYYRDLAAVHAGAHAGGAPVARRDPKELLDRMIDAKLVAQEAENIGLAELPEFTKAMDAFRRDTARDLLMERRLRKLPEPDPTRVETLYRQEVGQVRLLSVRVKDAADAAAFAEAVRKGGDFTALAKKLVADGKGDGGGLSDWIGFDKLLPGVVTELATLEPGGVSKPVPVGDGVAVFRLVERRYPEDAAARDRARAAAVREQRGAAAAAYVETLQKSTAHYDSKLIDGLDFDAGEAGFEKLRKDDRVVVRIDGGDPVRVSDVAEALRMKFFHGVEGAIERGRVNRYKEAVIEDLTANRVLQAEARRQKIAETEEFETAVEEHREQLLFGAFIRKAVDPDVKFTEKDVRAYYDAHASEYTTPARVEIQGMAFLSAADAESAAAKLHAGADFQWVKANSDGRVREEDRADVLQFPRGSVALDDLPENVRKAIDGAAAGDARLLAGDHGLAYVVKVVELTPPAQAPFESVARDLVKQVFAERRNAVLADWTSKLRAASDIKTFVDRDGLRRVLDARMAGR